jgi:hypothetical protein
MVAKLSGPISGTAATVKCRGKYYFVPPKGKPKEVPADSHTDCLHASIWMMNEMIENGRKKKA